MPYTCFEPEGSSSGGQLYIQLQYGTIYMHHYKQYSRQYSVFDTTCWAACTDPCTTYHTIPYLYIQPSSEDESWGSKHIVDIKIEKLKY